MPRSHLVAPNASSRWVYISKETTAWRLGDPIPVKPKCALIIKLRARSAGTVAAPFHVVVQGDAEGRPLAIVSLEPMEAPAVTTASAAAQLVAVYDPPAGTTSVLLGLCVGSAAACLVDGLSVAWSRDIREEILEISQLSEKLIQNLDALAPGLPSVPESFSFALWNDFLNFQREILQEIQGSIPEAALSLDEASEETPFMLSSADLNTPSPQIDENPAVLNRVISRERAMQREELRVRVCLDFEDFLSRTEQLAEWRNQVESVASSLQLRVPEDAPAPGNLRRLAILIREKASLLTTELSSATEDGGSVQMHSTIEFLGAVRSLCRNTSFSSPHLPADISAAASGLPGNLNLFEVAQDSSHPFLVQTVFAEASSLVDSFNALHLIREMADRELKHQKKLLNAATHMLGIRKAYLEVRNRVIKLRSVRQRLQLSPVDQHLGSKEIKAKNNLEDAQRKLIETICNSVHGYLSDRGFPEFSAPAVLESYFGASSASPLLSDLLGVDGSCFRPDIRFENFEGLTKFEEGGHSKLLMAKCEEKKVALKVFDLSRADNSRRFLREVSNLRRLRGITNVVQMRSYFFNSSTEGVIELDYFPRQHMGSQYCEDLRSLSDNQKLHLAYKLIFAVAQVHKLGMVVRDIKFKNILMDEDGSPHLADFDSAHCLHDMENDATISKTDDYAAPEAMAEPSSDIFSLGIVLGSLFHSTGALLNSGFQGLGKKFNLDPELQRRIREPDVWKDFVKKAMKLTATPNSFFDPALSRMLLFDPNQRATAAELLEMNIFSACRRDIPHDQWRIDWLKAKKSTGQEVYKVPIESEEVLQAVATAMNARRPGHEYDLTSKEFVVKKVIRCEQTESWMRYLARRTIIVNAANDRNIQLYGESTACRSECLNRELGVYEGAGERLLFHGTLSTNIDAILWTGLTNLFSVESVRGSISNENSGKKFGAGVYAAELAIKSHKYVDKEKSKDGTYKMFLVRMMMGNACVLDKYRKNLLHGPCYHGCIDSDGTLTPCMDEKGKRHLRYDSVVAQCPDEPYEYVIYDESQVHIEYLIEYSIQEKQATQ